MAPAEIPDEPTAATQTEARLRAELRYLREELRAAHDPATTIGMDAGLARTFENVRRVAPTDAIVLITGEAGTGKELIARAVHAGGRRAARPFIKLDCAASPSTAESALFGGEDGEGRLELAQGGTLFLDEVSALTAAAQARLVRLLQEREFDHSAGGRVPLDVRFIAATRLDLRRGVQEGFIREDLYYRLNVFPI